MSDSLEQPRAEGSERAVLAISMANAAAAAEMCRQLTPSDFYQPANQVIFTAINRLVSERQPTDAVSVWAKLETTGDDRVVRDGPMYLHDLYSHAPATAALDYHLTLVKDAGARRELAKLGTTASALAGTKSSGPATALIDTIRAQLDSISATVVDSDIPVMSDVLEEALTEIDRVGKDGVIVGLPTGFPDLDGILNGFKPGQMIVVAGRPAMGKALALDTPLPTPTGWTTMGDITTGDYVFGPGGNPTRVTAVTEVMTNHDCYNIQLDDGTVITADADHLWWPTVEPDTGNPDSPWILNGTQEPFPITTRELAETFPENHYAIPFTTPLELPPMNLPAGVTVFSIGEQFLNAINPATPDAAYRFPARVLRGSVPQRAGLLTSILTHTGSGAGFVGSIATAHAEQALDLQDLFVGLGHIATLAPDMVTVNYRVVDRPDAFTRVGRRITSITPVVSVPVRCIEVDAPDHMYLAGRSMVATHNSTLMLDFVRAAAFQHHKSVLLFSLEMSRMEVMIRAIAAQARVELTHLITGKLTSEEWDRVSRVHDKLANATFGIDDSAATTLADIRVKARNWQARHGLDLIAIDYLQLMSSNRAVENRQQELSEISRGIKVLAKELGVPVLALSQLNRGLEQRADKRPMLSDLRETGAIEQDGDVVMFVHREEVYSPETRVGEGDIIIAKQRGGPIGTVPVVAQLHYARFVPAAFTRPVTPADAIPNEPTTTPVTPVEPAVEETVAIPASPMPALNVSPEQVPVHA